jgi:hypothetical protein
MAHHENRELVRPLVELFNRYDLAGKEVSPDILGDGHEHILLKFAPRFVPYSRGASCRPLLRVYSSLTATSRINRIASQWNLRRGLA